MNFINSLKFLGVEAKQIPTIILHGAPSEYTEGAVGVLGMDVDSEKHDLYKCVAVSNGIYTWEPVGSGVSNFTIETQISDMPTGELTVTDSFKIKGVQGVSVSVDGDEVVFGIDGDSFPDGIGGSSLPEITANDAGKVLTANADGTAGWKESQGGAGGGGGTEILTFDSVEEMNASNAPEGSIAIVPSTGGGGGSGLPTVTLTTVPTAETVDLTAEESAAMDAVAAFGEEYGTPIILNCKIPDLGGEDLMPASMVANRFALGMYYIAESSFGIVMLMTLGSGWFASFIEDSTATSSTEAQAVI